MPGAVGVIGSAIQGVCPNGKPKVVVQEQGHLMAQFENDSTEILVGRMPPEGGIRFPTAEPPLMRFRRSRSVPPFVCWLLLAFIPPAFAVQILRMLPRIQLVFACQARAR